MTALDDFLDRRTRYGMLTTLRGDGSPSTVPVWFDWDGETLWMFSAASGSKLSRLERDPRVSVTVSNDVDEPEYWVAFDGEARIEETGGLALAERLAPQYWDLDDPARATMFTAWKDAGEEAFRLIVVDHPTVRTYG